MALRNYHNGLLELRPTEAEVSDQLWVCAGPRAPLALCGSDIDSIEAENLYKLVDQAYLHGVMRGEAAEAVETL